MLSRDKAGFSWAGMPSQLLLGLGDGEELGGTAVALGGQAAQGGQVWPRALGHHHRKVLHPVGGAGSCLDKNCHRMGRFCWDPNQPARALEF